jgi:hypothetical protein
MTEKEINRIEYSTRKRKRFYALFIVEPTAKIAPGAALLRRPALCRPEQADPAATSMIYSGMNGFRGGRR